MVAEFSGVEGSEQMTPVQEKTVTNGCTAVAASDPAGTGRQTLQVLRTAAARFSRASESSCRCRSGDATIISDRTDLLIG
jgi:hypothetical protein